ncbi:MAG: hypothetical protein RBS95_09240, partial [Desulfobulbus sp.]|nr:hypothetical protein [Desulfobulbus sp.]
IYDFAPLKKWGTIVLAALALAGATWSIRQEVLQKKEIQKAQAEASQERNQYLMRRLETVKKQTIEAELKKANREQLALAEKTPRNRQVSKGLPIYTWTNERGQTVYSNKPREK